MGITLGGCWRESRPLSSQAITALQALALTFNVESAFLAHGGFTLWDTLLTFLFTLTQTHTIVTAAVDSYGFRPCPVSIREAHGSAEEAFKEDLWVSFWVLTHRKKTSLVLHCLLLLSTSKNLASRQQCCCCPSSNGKHGVGSKWVFTPLHPSYNTGKICPHSELSQWKNLRQRTLLRTWQCWEGWVFLHSQPLQPGNHLLLWWGHPANSSALEEVTLGQWTASSWGLRALKQHLTGFLIQALVNAVPAQLHLAPSGELFRSSFSSFNRVAAEEMGSSWKSSECWQLSTAFWACWHHGAFVVRMSLCPGWALRSPQEAHPCRKERKHFHSYSEMLQLLKQKSSPCFTPLFPSLG